MENTNATLTPDQNIILEAKATRAKGDMLGCLELVEKVQEPSAESIRLKANTYIDLDFPCTARDALDKYNELPKDKQSLMDVYKNLDVSARIYYKLARYDMAMEYVIKKIELSTDISRELPLYLWIATVSKNIDAAVTAVKDIVGEKEIYDLNPYEIKSLTLFDKMFNLNKLHKNEQLINMCLEKLGEFDKPSVDVDNGPYCFILSNIGYHDKPYIVRKFIEQNYLFESSITDMIIHYRFIEMRRELYLKGVHEGDENRELFYMAAKTIDQAIQYGIFPL